MDALTATAASAAATTTAAAKTPADASTTKKSFSALFAEAKKDLKSGEKLAKVDGHPIAHITGGARDDQYVNLSGNDRSGKTFDLVKRGGHEFHVYGTGKERVIVELGGKAAAKTDATTTPTTTDASGTTGTTDTTGAATTTGTTDTSTGTSGTTTGTATTGSATAGSGTTSGTGTSGSGTSTAGSTTAAKS